MGTEREARMLAAGDKIEVNGKEYTLRPVVVQHLCDLEMEALRDYKRSYLRTFSDNADLLENGNKGELLDRKLEEVARWTLKDLPQMTAYDVTRVPVTDKLRKWSEEQYKYKASTDMGVLAMLATALDNKQITPEQVRKLTNGKGPVQGRVRYDQWWVTASMNGRIHFLLCSVRHEHPELTANDLGNWPPPKVMEAARKAERLTAASMGNG